MDDPNGDVNAIVIAIVGFIALVIALIVEMVVLLFIIMPPPRQMSLAPTPLHRARDVGPFPTSRGCVTNSPNHSSAASSTMDSLRVMVCV